MARLRGTPLLASILSVLCSYCAIEAVVFVAVSVANGFDSGLLMAFFAVQAVFHLALLGFLVAAGDFFYNVGTGEPLERVNIANKVTLLRVSMLPSILFMILAGKDHQVAPILVPMLALTFLTDMIDGRLSRARNQVTQIGRILDSVSDYSLLFVIAIAYFIYGLLPAWLFAVIVFRLAFQATGMLIMLVTRKSVEPQPTLFGKAAVATTMVLFAIEALKLFAFEAFGPIFGPAEIAAGVIVGLSVIDKGWFFVRKLLRKN